MPMFNPAAYASPSTGLQAAKPFTFNMFDTELFNRTIDIPNPNQPTFTGTSQPNFSDIGSILNPPQSNGVIDPMAMFNPTQTPAGYQTDPYGSANLVNLPQNAQVQPLANPAPVSPVTAPQATTLPSFTGSAPSTDMFASFQPQDAANPTWATTADGSGSLDMFSGLTGKDWLQGLGGAAQLGLGAYGMFRGLDQMDTKLSQGQQALDLSRDEYTENLRHRNAIVAQNKGA